MDQVAQDQAKAIPTAGILIPPAAEIACWAGCRGQAEEVSPTQSIAVGKMWSDGTVAGGADVYGDHMDVGLSHTTWAAPEVASVGVSGTLEEILGAGWEDGSLSFESELRL